MKVIIIEDDPEIVETVSLILKIRWSGCKVLAASTGRSGIELVENETPDAVILDLGLPDIDGFDVLKQLRFFSNVPTIIVTVRGEESSIVRGLEMGADDYIVKPFGQMELLARVQAILRRAHFDSEDNPLTVGALHYTPSFSKLDFNGNQIELTNIEGRLLYLLMKNPGVVLSNTTIAERIWGDYYPGVTNNIRVYIKRLRKKIEIDPTHPELIVTKIGVGYLLQKPG